MVNRLVMSYMGLRKTIGATGILLFLLVAIGGMFSGTPIQDSISAYYWTNSGDVLVGVLFMAGAFLLTYKGYDLMDNVLTISAGTSAIGIAIFPCFNAVSPVGYFQLSEKVTGTLHFIFAVLFFVTLSIMSYFQFTKGEEKGRKKKRNLIYRICGLVMFGMIVVLAVLHIVDAVFSGYNVTYYVEAVMLGAFGVSWLTKGQAILKDK